MIEYNTVTVFSSRDEAERCADANSRGEEDGWTYRVVRVQLDPPRWVVEIRDEDGFHVANM